MESSGGGPDQPPTLLLRRTMNLGESMSDDEVVPSSVIEIVNIIDVAKEFELVNPRVSHLCKLSAVNKAAMLDPTSAGVPQFRTALLQCLEQNKELQARCKGTSSQTNYTYYKDYCKEDMESLSYEADRVRLCKPLIAKVLLEVLKDARQGCEIYSEVQGGWHRRNNGAFMSFDTEHSPKFQAAIAALRNTSDLPWMVECTNDYDILDWLQATFGFQKDNVSRRRKMMIFLLANVWTFQQDNEPKLNENVLSEVMPKLLQRYLNWCKYVNCQNIVWMPMTHQHEEKRVLLYICLQFLVSGEAGNLRFMPECLCYIYHHMAFELHEMLTGSATTGQKINVAYGGGDEAFVRKLVTPICEMMEKAAKGTERKKFKASGWTNYDAINEYFWSSDCFDLGWPIYADTQFFESRGSIFDKNALMWLLHIAISNICYARELFPERYFTEDLGTRFKMLVPKDSESRRVMSWLKKGVHNALKKKNLSTFIFFICEDLESKPYEEYYFFFDYVGNDEVVMSLNLPGNTKTHTFNVCTTDAPFNQTEYMARRMVLNLTECMCELEQLPEKRAISSKLLYYDDFTPVLYEPPFFECCIGSEPSGQGHEIKNNKHIVSDHMDVVISDQPTGEQNGDDKVSKSIYGTTIIAVTYGRKRGVIIASDSRITTLYANGTETVNDDKEERKIKPIVDDKIYIGLSGDVVGGNQLRETLLHRIDLFTRFLRIPRENVRITDVVSIAYDLYRNRRPGLDVGIVIAGIDRRLGPKCFSITTWGRNQNSVVRAGSGGLCVGPGYFNYKMSYRQALDYIRKEMQVAYSVDKHTGGDLIMFKITPSYKVRKMEEDAPIESSRVHQWILGLPPSFKANDR